MEQNNQEVTLMHTRSYIGLPIHTLSLSSQYDLLDYWLTYVNNN